MRWDDLSLSLLVFGVFANDHDFALAFDNLAFLAHGLYRRSYFHVSVPPVTCFSRLYGRGSGRKETSEP